eukprot:1258986-Pyramimonas_sp.AAC.2
MRRAIASILLWEIVRLSRRNSVLIRANAPRTLTLYVRIIHPSCIIPLRRVTLTILADDTCPRGRVS